jgi:hypothetical protein
MNTNDGGSAFPHPEVARLQDGRCVVADADPGMTLRDWFAGKALAAIPHIGCGCDLRVEEVALAAYQLADAMLKAREVKP